MVNKICRTKAYFNVISRPAKLKLERTEIQIFYIFMSVSCPDADFSFYFQRCTAYDRKNS
ncbi:MAG: hypothetical protein BHW52_11860 [Ruminococcus sp. 37_24]|nr:MAG: hypothetical protein BHW52_11860 [Ruminococcus sp. 37_24]